MVNDDAIRWDNRYKNNPEKWKSYPRNLLKSFVDYVPQQGLGLDVAMGLGSNSKFLLERGLKVIGIDISRVAVFQAKKQNPDLMAVIANLADLNLDALRVDVILNFYYLQRELFLLYPKILNRGGLLFIETLTAPMKSIKPDIDPKYLLEEGELKEYFQDWEIFHYFEGWVSQEGQRKKAIASLVARRPNMND